MKRIKLKTKLFFIAYVILLLVESFVYVPYDRIEVFTSKQNVPHSEIIGSGYATLSKISCDNAPVFASVRESTGKRVNTFQLFINMLFTTVIFSALYFMFFYKNHTKTKSDGKQISLFDVEPPFIDLNMLAFSDKETQQQAFEKFGDDMYNYVKNRLESEK